MADGARAMKNLYEVIRRPLITEKTTNLKESQRTLGFDQGASGDQIAMVRSVVNWLNSRGGIAGRRIKLAL